MRLQSVSVNPAGAEPLCCPPFDSRREPNVSAICGSWVMVVSVNVTLLTSRRRIPKRFLLASIQRNGPDTSLGEYGLPGVFISPIPGFTLLPPRYVGVPGGTVGISAAPGLDRKSTRLNSSHRT